MVYFVSESAQVELNVDECKPLVRGTRVVVSPHEVGRCRLTLSHPS
jgi:hypothetical protein